MRAVIIEDEQRAIRRLLKMIDEVGIDVEILASLTSVKEAREWFYKNDFPDFIISDIQLGDGKAFEIFEELETPPPIIFTTAYDEFALRAFKNNGIDYLLKPIDPHELKVALNKVKRGESNFSNVNLDRLASLLLEEKEAYKSRFMVKIGEKLRSIPINDISCFYSVEGGTYLQTSKRKNYVIDFSMEQLEGIIDPTIFFRVNRKLITCYNSIDTIHMWSGSRLKIELSCAYDEDVVVSRDRVKEFKQWLDR